MVEISCHGGPLVLRKVLGMAVELGARLAGPGEFSKRAFLNGRIDLAQAEAVLDVISAKSDASLAVAASQLEGALSRRVRAAREAALLLLTQIEASIDYPDEVGEIEPGLLDRQINDQLGEIERLLATAGTGRLLRDGVRTAIVGRPNVGKSSLLNALLGESRAIVTDIPGTTRDTIEEVVNLGDLPLVVIDTAGIRHPRDKVEEFGVERTRNELRQADLVLVVLDASEPLKEEDQVVLDEALRYNSVVVLNKVDIAKSKMVDGRLSGLTIFRVSALTGQGVEELKESLLDVIGRGQVQEKDCEVGINARHRECLIRARESLLRARETAANRRSVDLVAIDLRGAIESLEEVNGESVSDEVVNAIFANFCVGK
jgi:tRNA modification GTPase